MYISYQFGYLRLCYKKNVACLRLIYYGYKNRPILFPIVFIHVQNKLKLFLSYLSICSMYVYIDISKHYNKLVPWPASSPLANTSCMMLYSWSSSSTSVPKLEDALELLTDLTGDVLGLTVLSMTVSPASSESDSSPEKSFSNCE